MANTRVGTYNAFDSAVRNINSRYATLSSLQENLTSGKRVLRPSDDPTAAAQAERARTRIARVETDQRALALQKDSITTAESTLGEANDALQSFRELVVSAGNGSYSATERAAILQQLTSLRDEIYAQANRSDSNGIPLFTPVAGEIRPSEKLARGPDTGTPWRKANWRFLESQLAQLPAEAWVLDVGAGRGDFAALLDRFQTIALDIYPYPEIDLVCDLTVCNPFRPASFDAIVLMNVLEPVYDTHALLGRLSELLKPGGILITAIPFLVKLHQTPLDFVRYTHFALERFAPQHGLVCELLEGYYDPLFLLSEGTGNIKNAY
jgi:2-polyprenyl-3-methyl-5-hydroxy-6-metoxy-1,4-benzoquinol methylase